MNKKYQIIYADPPWDYEDKKSNDPSMGGITYPTMKLEDIKNLPVKNIADDNSVLFMWATMPLLQEAFEVIKSWGFNYRTCAFVWVKQNPNNDYKHPELFFPTDKGAFNIYSGIGHWTNGNAELCLFGKRGEPKRLNKDVKQIVLAPRSRHSEKPPEVRDRIVRLMGDLPRIELFARQKTKGWTAVGYDIDGKDIRELNETNYYRDLTRPVRDQFIS